MKKNENLGDVESLECFNLKNRIYEAFEEGLRFNRPV